MEACTNLKENKKQCTCTYQHCANQGTCCECLRYHWQRRELPGCLFPPEVEKTYDRSLRKFIETYK